MIGSNDVTWHVYYHSSEYMPEVADESVQIVMGSPPFTNHFDGSTLIKDMYLAFIESVLGESYRVLTSTGYLIVVNTDNRDHNYYNRNQEVSFEGLIWQKHIDLKSIAEKMGFVCLENKIWVKTLKRNLYRYTFSYIQFFTKKRGGNRKSLRLHVGHDFAADVWFLEGGLLRKSSKGFVFRSALHPQLVQRCIRELSSPGDLIVCPFAGSGTVLSVAKLMGRTSIGYEVNIELAPLIEESITTPEQFSAYSSVLGLHHPFEADS